MKSIGLMSGTSLDGLDICYAEFHHSNGVWTYNNLITKSVAYPSRIDRGLRKAYSMSSKDLEKWDAEYGIYLGEEVLKFIRENKLEGQIDFIASHGHTVFHEPEKGITVQVGNGDKIAATTGIQVVNDFRIKDVQLKGQGAPLVPVGDKLLFGEYQACLNLGGIANISFDKFGERVAFDICPCNLPLNKVIFENLKLKYDDKGNVAQSGQVISELLDEFNNLSYYKRNPPKSLGVEWLFANFYPLIEKYQMHPVEDILKTIVVHAATQIALVLNENKIEHCLVTGGGAYHEFLIQSIQDKTNTNIVIPDAEIVEFKEALIFAFLGALHMRGEINTYKSVTGALKDSVGGILHKPS